MGVPKVSAAQCLKLLKFQALKFVIRDYLKQKGRQRDDRENFVSGDDLWSPVTTIVSPNETNTGDLDVIGVVGPYGSSVTLQVANLLSLFQMPQV